MRRTWMGIIVVAAAVLFGLLLFPGSGYCIDKYFSGSRALGMAGSNVASAKDNAAQFYNPAAFGFFGRGGPEGEGKTNKRVKSKSQLREDNNNLGGNSWRIQAASGVGVRLHEDLPQLLDDLSSIKYKDISAAGVSSQSALQNLVDFSDILSKLDDPGNAVTMDSNGGMSFGLGHFAIGGYYSLQANARVTEVDKTNLGLNYFGANLSADIAANAPGDGSRLVISNAQRDQLVAVGFTLPAIESIDLAARNVGLTAEQTQRAVNLLEKIGVATDAIPGTLANNTTSAELRGFGMAEVPLSYGWALNDNLSVGGNIKAMVGRVYASQVLVFDTESGEVLNDITNDYAESTTFGVDLGVLYRIKMWQAGLVCRNANSPKFDGPTIRGRTYEDVTIDPGLTAGLAFIPFERLTLETDYDLTKNETAYPGYDTQYLSFGAEWMLLDFLALRAGMYGNQAESDIGWMYTAGLGMSVWGVRFDLAGAMAAETAEFDGQKYPVEARAMAQLSFGF